MSEAQVRPEVARVTYAYLRWLMICVPALLFVVTMLTALSRRELETSISAFYGGPVRDVFVGALFAIAACLVAYQGVGLLEDYALNGAGFYAVFVALVPTGFAGLMEELRRNPNPDGVDPVQHVVYLRIALTCVVVLCGVLFARELGSGRIRQLFAPVPGTALANWMNRAFLLLTAVLLAGFLTLAMWQLWLVPADEVTMEGLTIGPVQLTIHDLAAVFLIASLAVAVLTNTWPFYRLADLWSAGRFFYLVIFALMTLGALVPVLAARAFAPDHVVIFLEWWEIALFAVFWALETRREARQARGELNDDPAPGPLQQPPRAAG